ncbi:MAG: hypothetical protein LH616_16765 [Ilumatobacteraceae bacterium]|nr:hypothetical protein [Ilumatobacteraceae bacterium]
MGPLDSVVVSGQIGTEVGFVRYLANGARDTSFSGDGVATIPLTDARLYEFVVQPDGKIVAAIDVPGGEFRMVRLLADGTFDASFGTGGQTVLTRPPGTTGYFGVNQGDHLSISPDGSIVYMGTSSPSSVSTDYLAKLSSTGVLDTSFGTAGFWIAGSKIFDYEFYADNKILVAQATGTYCWARCCTCRTRTARRSATCTTRNQTLCRRPTVSASPRLRRSTRTANR